MGRINLLIVCLFIFYTSYSQTRINIEYFAELKKLTNLEDTEQLIIIFQANGNCEKCYTIPMYEVKSIKENNPKQKFKLLALVQCDRDIEVNIFKKKYKWKHFLARDDGNALKKLNIPKSTILIVIDSKGNIVKQIVEKF